MTIQLSDTQLQALRAAIAADPGAVGKTIIGTVQSLHGPAGLDFMAFLKLSQPTRANPSGPEVPAFSSRERELMILAILAAREPGLELAIHIYLGLMAGLSVEDVCDVFRLAGVYTGVDNYASGLYLLDSVCAFLESAASVDPASILTGLSQRFTPFATPSAAGFRA